MKRTAFFLAALLFLAGCGAPAPSSQPAPEVQVVEVEPERFFATPYALEDVGYFLDIPEDIGIHDPNPEDPERKIFPVGRPYQVVEPDFLDEPGGFYGASCLSGRVTLIQPLCHYLEFVSAGDTPLCFSILQAFRNDELEQPGVRIPFYQRYSRYQRNAKERYGKDPADLERFVVYRDEAVTVYDFFPVTDAPSLEEQLRAKAREPWAQYEEKGIDYLWFLEVERYFAQDVGRFIKPIPTETG